MENLAVQVQLEQFGATCRSFADVVGTYHAALLKAGVSEHLADALVSDWHSQWWEAMLAKTGQ